LLKAQARGGVPADARLHVLAADTDGRLEQGLICARQRLAAGGSEFPGEWTIVVDSSRARWKARPADPGSLVHLRLLLAYVFAHLWPALRAAKQAAAAAGVLLVPTALAVPRAPPAIEPGAAASEAIRVRCASSAAEAVFIAATAVPSANVLECLGSVLVDLPRGTCCPAPEDWSWRLLTRLPRVLRPHPIEAEASLPPSLPLAQLGSVTPVRL